VALSNAAPAPDPKRAQRAAAAGEKAAAEGNWEEALSDYDEAVRYAPKDTAIATRRAVLRAQMVRIHVNTAERVALGGNLPEAIEELHMAMRIDPTNTVVAERIAQMQAMSTDEQVGKARAAATQQEFAGVPRIRPQPGKHDFNEKGDTKFVYEQVAKAFGVKATFDAEIPSRTVQLRVEGVDFETAMTVLADETGTFWRPVSSSLVFIAQDTPEKRKQYAIEAEQTFMLPASVAPEEMTELLRMLRQIVGSLHIELSSAKRSITVRDTPENLKLIGEVIQQVERDRGEIMLEIELLEVDKNKSRELGITPPSSAQAFLISPNDIAALAQSTSLAGALTTIGQLFQAQGFSTVPPFTLIGGGYTRFLLTLPSVAANFSDALSLVKSGQQVLMRAQDGKPATFFVGERYPVTLSLLSGSLGTGTGTSTTTAGTGIPTSTNFPETSFAVGNNPVALAAASYSGGILPDLAVANKNDNTISILLNQDSGNFTAAANSPYKLPSTETGPVAIASGVFGNTVVNSSGVTVTTEDLVIVNSGTDNVTVLLGNGDGTFTEAAGSPYAVGHAPTSVIVADFNGDGFLDFAVANSGDNTISVFQGNGSGGFTAAPNSPFALTNNSTVSEKAPVAMATANFRNGAVGVNGAPESDLAIVNQATNNVTILLDELDTNGNLRFAEATGSPIAVGQSPVAIAAGDINADGVPDVVVANQSDNTISVLLGSTNEDGTFTAASSSPIETAATPAGIAIANFTGSATPALAVTSQGTSTLNVYLGLGSATFSTPLQLQVPTSPGALISQTLTSSGLPDAALVAQGTTSGQGVVTIIQDSSTFATGTVPAQTPYPGSEFVDLGVKVKATPTLNANREVTVKLEFEIRALAGQSINGIPVISNRTLDQTVRLKEDEPSLISGLLDQQETRALTGLPGLANIPILGYAFGSRTNSLQDTEFLIMVTPHRLRDPNRIARAIFAGRGEGAAVHGEGTTQPEPPPPPPREH
jgi:Flp pilus assembly secretin CpaC